MTGRSLSASASSDNYSVLYRIKLKDISFDSVLVDRCICIAIRLFVNGYAKQSYKKYGNEIYMIFYSKSAFSVSSPPQVLTFVESTSLREPTLKVVSRVIIQLIFTFMSSIL